MVTKWTDEQKKVIETRHRNLLFRRQQEAERRRSSLSGSSA